MRRAACFGLFLSAWAAAQGKILIEAARLCPGSSPPQKDVWLLVADGRIATLGPAGSFSVPNRVRRLQAAVVLPGLVVPLSRLGLGLRAERIGTRFANEPTTNPTAEVFLRQPLWAALRKRGVTTLALAPRRTGGATGTVSLVRPGEPERERFVWREGVWLRIGFGGGATAKNGLRTLLERARREEEKVERAKKRRAEWEKRQKGRQKKGKKGTAQPASRGPRVPEIPAKLLPIVRARRGELPVLVEVPDRTALEQFFAVLGERHPLKTVVALDGRTALEALPLLREKGVPVLLPPLVVSERYRRAVRRNPARELAEAGVRFAFVPAQDSLEGMAALFFHLGRLVRSGLRPEAALRAVTRTPAELLGVAGEVGSVEPGKRADLLLFTADPLTDATARLTHVIASGEVVTVEAGP